MDLSNKNILIIGYGVSGQGAEFAIKMLGGSVYILDESKQKTMLTKKFVCQFDLVIVSPSVPICHTIYDIASSLSVEVISEVELGARLFNGTVVGITGTNGKTTVTQLMGAMLENAGLKTSVCGNVGNSFAKCASEDKSDFAALELSSFQLEQMGSSLKPKIAMFLNLSPDHLDRHGNMDSYAKAKKNIAKNQDKNDYLILSSDDIPLEYLDNFTPKSKVFYVSLNKKVDGAYLLGETLYFDNDPIITVSDIRIRGRHNIANSLFCIAGAKLLGIASDIIVKTLKEFSPDSHRINLYKTVKGKKFYNDSKGTNIGACLAACNSMIGNTALILGGKDKGYEFIELFNKLPKAVTHIFAVGEAAQKIYDAAVECYFNSIQITTLENAVKASLALAVENVLLSPACASFDQFSDYKERGKYFESLVELLDK